VSHTLIEELPSAAAERLVEASTSRTYGAGSIVFLEGDDPTAAFVVDTGLLRVDRTLRSGRSVLLTLMTPGEMVGGLSLIDSTPRSATVMAVTDSTLLVVGARRFHDLLATDTDLARVMLRRVTRRLRSLTDQFVETAAFSARSRIAARLVELMHLTGNDPEAPIELSLPITQEELAQWAGLSREGAVKGLAELRRTGLIETGRKRIMVLDPPALRRAADDVTG